MSDSTSIKSATLNKLNDPGHGWLSVPHQLILDLGIADQITTYSYMTATRVLLEEDSDASTFLRAADKAGVRIEYEAGTYSHPVQKGIFWIVGHDGHFNFRVGSGVHDLGWGRSFDADEGRFVPTVSKEDAVATFKIKSSYSDNSSVRSYAAYDAKLVGQIKPGLRFRMKLGQRVVDASIVEKHKRQSFIVATKLNRYRVPGRTIADFIESILEEVPA